MDNPKTTQNSSTGMVGSSGPGVKPRKPERCPWSKTQTSAPNAALSDSAFMSTALNGSTSERSSIVSTMIVVISTKPMASGVWSIM